uniref:Uncharacterized protein n=1 Tax=Triticum urartu TaxID=4572 RepID=A0A8R7PQA1_TRIUA
MTPRFMYPTERRGQPRPRIHGSGREGRHPKPWAGLSHAAEN